MSFLLLESFQNYYAAHELIWYYWQTYEEDLSQQLFQLCSLEFSHIVCETPSIYVSFIFALLYFITGFKFEVVTFLPLITILFGPSVIWNGCWHFCLEVKNRLFPSRCNWTNFSMCHETWKLWVRKGYTSALHSLDSAADWWDWAEPRPWVCLPFLSW